MLKKSTFLNYKFLTNYKTKNKKKFFNGFNSLEFIKRKSKEKKVSRFKGINGSVF